MTKFKKETRQTSTEEDNSSLELDNFIAAERSLKSVLRTAGNGDFNVMNVPAATLDKLLGKFFKGLCKQNGGKYEPDSISSFQKRTQRHLKELKLPFNILQE